MVLLMNNLLPNFQGGVLPQGDYQMTFAALRSSHLVRGGGSPEVGQWDISWRSYLVDNLEIMVRQLWEVGIDHIFIDGSFA